MAEARAKVAKEREASDKGKQTSSSLSQPPPKARQSPREFHEKSYSQDTGMEEDEDEDDDLFMSYRDLYYDEQVRREEKLASAGERLKERMNNLAQMKSSRQTILDPRLSLNLRKRRRGQTLPTGRHHWSKESRPKTLTEKARARASQLAFAYDPPRFTRSASMKVGFIPQKPKPVYKESSLEDVQPSQATTKGIFGPRRGKPSLEACQAANEAFSRKGSNAHAKATSFIERTVTRPIKSSVDRPYKLLELPTHGIPGNSVTKTATPPRSAQNHIQPITRAPIQAAPASSSEVQIPRPTINIPGITRRPILQKKGSEHGQTLAPTDTSVSPAGSPPLSTAIASSPPPPASTSSLSSTPVPNLPMMSQPRKVPSGPSLFIPRKRAK